GSDFDATLEAIQRAIETQDFVLDRRWMPWVRTRGERGEADKWKLKWRIWENQPGTLLFRKTKLGDRELLTVFLVGESPTEGIRKEAFSTSVRYARGLSTEAKSKLRVVSPIYSGSAYSLRLALQALCNDKQPIEPIEIISGSAIGVKPAFFTGLPCQIKYRT